MAHTVTLDGLDLTAAPYSVKRIPTFRQPQKRTDIQPFLQQHGGEIVQGSDFYGLVTHTIPVFVDGDDLDDLYANVQALQKKIQKTNVVLEYKFDGATNSNFADVLSMTASNPFEGRDWDILVESLKVLMQVQLLCSPFWRGLLETSAVTSYTQTPTALTFGTIKGDVQTAAVIHMIGSSATSFGDNIIIGTRESRNAFAETSFVPEKDFQGNSTGGMFNDQYSRFTGVSSSSWTTLGTTGPIGSADINGLSMNSSLVGYAVSDAGVVLRTQDGWTTITNFTSGETGTNQNLNDIKAFTTALVFAVGNSATIIKSTDSGATWNVLPTTFTADLNVIDMASSSEIWAGGSTSTLVKSINGGSSFTKQNTSSVMSTILTIHAIFASTINSNAVWVGSNSNQSIVTHNGGSSWALMGEQRTSTGLSWNGVEGFDFHFATTLKGWVVGSAGTVLFTSDGGDFWTVQRNALHGTNNLLAIHFASTGQGVTVGQSGIVYSTTDSGATWTNQATVAVDLNDVSLMATTQSATAIGDGFTFIKSTDVYDTWEPVGTGSAWAFSNEYIGSYRPYARVRTDSTNSTGVWLRANIGFTGGDVISGTSTPLGSTSNDMQWVDLGVAKLPPTNLSSGVDSTPFIEIQALNGASSGSVTVDIDVAVIIPIDGEHASVDALATIAKPVTLDINQEAVNQGTDIVDWVGDPGIRLNPGTNNNAALLETELGTTTADEGINAVDVFFTYFPRFLSPVAGSST